MGRSNSGNKKIVPKTRMNKEIKNIMAGNLKVPIGSFPVSRRKDFLYFLLGKKDKTQDKKNGKFEDARP